MKKHGDEPMNKIGLGCWGFGGNSYGQIPINKSLDVISEAHRLGASVFDLSNLYGSGRAEVVFGEWLQFNNECNKNTINIVTKAGLLPHSGFDMPYDFSVESLIVEIKRSIERLNVDVIPIFLLHSPDVKFLSNTNIENIILHLKSTGLVKNVGISLRSPYDLLKFDSKCLDWIEINYNLMDMRFDEIDGIKEIILNNSIKVIARTPLAFGFLTEMAPNNSSIFSKNSHLKNWSIDQIEIWRNGAEKYKRIAHDYGLTIEQLALSFCITNPLISHVIPGAMSTDQVKKNMLGIRQLNSNEISSLQDIYHNTDFYVQKK